jgi:ribonuclease Z
LQPFEINILGIGSATPQLGRHMSAQLLKIHTQYILIDCGEGTQYQLLQYNLPISKINYIFISHLHGDHYFGLIALLSTMSMYGRSNDLIIFAPKGLKEIIDIQLKYSESVLNYSLTFIDLDTTFKQVLFQEKKWYVEYFPLNHRIKTFGFLFKENIAPPKLIKSELPEDISLAEIAHLKLGNDVLNANGTVKIELNKVSYAPPAPRSYAYCSDTSYLCNLYKWINNVDVLYHESTFLNSLIHRAESTYHSTAEQAALVALEAQANTLILGHFSSRYKSTNEFELEAKSIFYNTYVSIEGMKVVINEPKENTSYVRIYTEQKK